VEAPRERQQLRVIVAEDDPGMRRWMRVVLTRRNIAVQEARSGAELLLLLTVMPEVDLVISDLRMPLLDGLDTLAMVREIGVDVPFLLITAFADETLRRSAEELDASVLDKPFSAGELIARVNALAAAEIGPHPARSNGSA
jgi:DNA-binding response OmpR family regulator